MSKPEESLIYDRTLSDVTSKLAKGNYNASDLNRVEEWSQYLADTLNSYSYPVTIVTKRDWNKYDLPTLVDINRIKNNLTKLKEAYFTLAATPNVDIAKTSINFNDANDIEKILYDIDYLINAMSKYFVHSGVAKAGQSRMNQNFFRRY